MTDTNKIINEISKKLKGQLPGIEAFSKLAPALNGTNYRTQQPNAATRKSAVLLLLNVKNGKLQIVFTLRSLQLISHSGQISFPGGKFEINETAVQTALRETQEEIGIPPHTITILGELTPIYVFPSNSLIHPVVGFSAKYLDFIVNHDEVQEAFTMPIDFFSFDSVEMKKWIMPDGEEVDVPFWAIHPAVPLWGATAMILSEFLTIYSTINTIYL